MHKQVRDVALLGALIRRGSKSSKSILEQINLQRVNPIEQHIYSEVELQIVNEERLIKIGLSYDTLFRVLDVVQVLQEIDTSSLAVMGWLHDESVGLFLLKLLLKCVHVRWKHVGGWKEIVVLGLVLFHQHEIRCHYVFV